MEEIKKSMTLTIGWVLLLVLGLLMSLAGVASMLTAYFGDNDPIASVGFDAMEKLHPDLPGAIRGRRATAATLSISYGMLLCWIAMTAYRRAEKWAWRAVLTSAGLGCVLSLLRVPVLGVTAGAAAAGIALGIIVLALAIPFRDFK